MCRCSTFRPSRASAPCSCRLEAGQPEQHRESSLKFQTRSVACFVDGRGYALGSVEGRVSMEFFDTSPEGQVRAGVLALCARASACAGSCLLPLKG